VVMIFVGGLVTQGCGEVMGCHVGAGRSVNFVHVQYYLADFRLSSFTLLFYILSSFCIFYVFYSVVKLSVTVAKQGLDSLESLARGSLQ